MGLGVVTDWFWESLFCLLKICIKCYFGRSYKVNSILFIPVLGNLLIISLLRKEMQGLFSACSWQREFGQGIWKSFSLQLRRFVMWGWCLTEIQDVPKELLYVEFVDVSSVPLAIGLTGRWVLGVPIIVQASQAEKNRASAMANNLQKGSAGPMRLYVGSLHFNITEDMLRGIFEPFGRVSLKFLSGS